jgi:oxygen-independent coproporphyrinogen-3 oxidase
MSSNTLLSNNAHLEPVRKGYMTTLEPARRGFITNFPNFQHWKNEDLSQPKEKKLLNIYIHLPYCIQRCSYCYYRTVNLKGNERNQQINDYVQALCKEIDLSVKQFDLSNSPVESVYFGGGTPTLMEKEHFEQILNRLRSYFNLDEAELTIEAEPVTLTEKKAQVLKDLGVTRISMGIQSFDNDIIKHSNRLDTAEKALKAIEIAQSTGATVNIDLMSGLAGESTETWQKSVNTALASGVDSITIYKMDLYANTPYYKSIRSEGLNLPTDDEELEFMQYALDRFKEEDYQPWSFFTFTKNGKNAHRHSPSIWRGNDLWSLGASAFGILGNWHYQNSNDEKKYMAQILGDKLAITRGHEMNCQEQMIRAVVLGMKLTTLDLVHFRERFGLRLEALCASTIERLTDEGYAVIVDNHLTMTEKGILHGDYVGKSLSRALLENY